MFTNIYLYIYRIILHFIIKSSRAEAFSLMLRKYYLMKYDIKIGYGTYGGCFTVGNIERGTAFGNYCSIAPGVKIFRANHPLNKFTTHPLFYNPVMGYVKKYMLEKPKLTVGNDVWIGANVIITPSVMVIGNGSIIGAGSVVTRDVPAYAVVAGNPAKIIKKRFPEEVIEKLESTQWWSWDQETLTKNKMILEKIILGEK